MIKNLILRLRLSLRIAAALALALFFTWWFCLPDPLFDSSYSTVLLDRNNQLLGARLAKDGQWRFPGDDLEIPETFKQAIIQFEDKKFLSHPGIDVFAFGRALRDNLKNNKITSGGSTITMQTMRLARNKNNRSFLQKTIEIIWAVRAEVKYSKDDILRLYASHAPFGGNVVGLGAASWRYFQKTPNQLSWGEAATLAVLPNAPGLIHPGRNREALLHKRNALLLKMAKNGVLTDDEASLAMGEPLPEQPYPLPDVAPHLLGAHKSSGKILSSTIDIDLQQRMQELLQRHADILSMNGVHNAALLVMETESGNVLTYIGNSTHDKREHQNDVDIITSERSSGSILKPFLYCAAIEDGLITPSGIMKDVPTYIRGYQPINFTQEYMGMVPADEALAMSLNVPAVLLLQQYGILPFKEKLQLAGISTLHYSPDHYGLPLVLGGAEVTLWDICGAYASLGRILSHTHKYQYKYDKADIHDPIVFRSDTQSANTKRAKNLTDQSPVWNSGAIWHTFEAMSTLRRPDQEGQWETFQSSRRIAWKTGTSFGYRDAWAIGVTQQYTIGVWVGNGDGEGRPGVIGLHASAPILFDALRMLNDQSDWWYAPYEALSPQLVCSESGWLAGSLCSMTDTAFILKNDQMPAVCDFHKMCFTNTDHTLRYEVECASDDKILSNYFVVPAVAETYYKRYNPSYKTLPQMDPDCYSGQPDRAELAIVYPRSGSRIYVPREWNNKKSKAIFSAVHRSDNANVYWHLDKKYIGRTKEFHQIEIDPSPGMHQLVLQDEYGSVVTTSFEVLSK